MWEVENVNMVEWVIICLVLFWNISDMNKWNKFINKQPCMAHVGRTWKKEGNSLYSPNGSAFCACSKQHSQLICKTNSQVASYLRKMIMYA